MATMELLTMPHSQCIQCNDDSGETSTTDEGRRKSNIRFPLSLAAATTAASTTFRHHRSRFTRGLSTNAPVSAAAPDASPSLLLRSIPKEVLARDILGFLTDKSIKTFLDSLGEKRLNSPSCSELRKQFCPIHGSRLEDPETFQTGTGTTLPDESMEENSVGNGSRKRRRKRCCPECHAEQHNTKRCNGCKVFYPRFLPGDNQENNKAFPGLWCQQCNRMAFCNACMSNEESGCGSHTPQHTQANNFPHNDAFVAFGRKRLPSNGNTRYCRNGRITCHNYCCPNVFTNTMCGEFICDDCGDERHRLARNAEQLQHDPAAVRIETCDECGKATCLDPNCLVCNDFRLIHMSCKFVPEDAYRIDWKQIVWGTPSSGSNSHSELSTKLRRNVSDGVVWIAVFAALMKMWWFQASR